MPRRAGPSVRVEATFCFIDIAGFTALTEAQGDEDAAAVATRLAALTRKALGRGDKLVKTIGDAVLVSCHSPTSAIALVDRLMSDAANGELPALRAGMHHGHAVVLDDDVFGAAVNLAARVAAEAYAGEILCTEHVAAAARDGGMEVLDLGLVVLKNVREAIPLFSIALLVGATDSVVDPVCQAAVDRRTAAGRLVHKAVEYWFCSLSCAAAFASNPAWHVGAKGR